MRVMTLGEVRTSDGAVVPLDLRVKPQWIRLFDVVLVGPLMFFGGIAMSRSGRPGWGTLLGALGLGTIALNGRNWLLVRAAERRQREQLERLPPPSTTAAQAFAQAEPGGAARPGGSEPGA